MGRSPRCHATLSGAVIALITLSLAGPALAQGPSPETAPALSANRSYSSVFPFEHVDPTSGSLSLTFTDLVLPGDGGRELRFTRTFQTSNPGAGWQMGIAGVPLAVRDTWGQPNDPARPVFETSNGWIGALIPLDENGGTRRIMLTDSFWTYDRQTRALSLPDGSVASFNTDGALSQVQDVFGQVVLTLTRTSAERQITPFRSHGQWTFAYDRTGDVAGPTAHVAPDDITAPDGSQETPTDQRPRQQTAKGEMQTRRGARRSFSPA